MYLRPILFAFLLVLCLVGCNLTSTTYEAVTTPLSPTSAPVSPGLGTTPVNDMGCTLAGDDLTFYTGPGEFYAIYDRVMGNSEWHPVATAAGWFKIPVSTGYIWLPSNHAFTKISGCENLPQESVSPLDSECMVTNLTGDFQAIRRSPSADTEMIARFPPGAQMPLIRQHGAWYEVYIDGLNLSGFIETSLVEAGDHCSALDQ